MAKLKPRSNGPKVTGEARAKMTAVQLLERTCAYCTTTYRYRKDALECILEHRVHDADKIGPKPPKLRFGRNK